MTTIRTLLACTTALVLVVLLAPQVPAPSAPTPGWVTVQNGLSVNADGACEGHITVVYGLRSVDVAAGVESIVDETDCSIQVRRMNADTQVIIGTTGRVAVTADAGGFGITAQFLESLGTTCSRISGTQFSTNGAFSPASSTPTAYGSNCDAGWTQTWEFDDCPFPCTVWDQVWGGLAQFGAPMCKEHIWATDGSTWSGNTQICTWDETATVSFSPGSTLIDRLDPLEIATVSLW